MAEPRVWRDKVSEVGTKWHRARIVDRNRNICIPADFTGSVTKLVYDLHADDADTALASNTSNIMSVVFGSLQSWDDDNRGYNFEMATTSNQVGGWEGGHTYRSEIFLTHVTEGEKALVFEITPEPLLGG